MSDIWSGIEFVALACAVIVAVWLTLIYDKVVPFVALLLSRHSRKEPVSIAPTKSESNLQTFLTWGLGLSLPSFGVALALAGQQFELSRIFFVLGMCALTSGFALSASARRYPQILIAVFGAVSAGVCANKINDWVTKLEIAAIASNGEHERDRIEAKRRVIAAPKTKGGADHSRCLISPSAGVGGPEYLGICDVQVAQRIIDMAAKIEDLHDDIDRFAIGATNDPKTRFLISDSKFKDDFEACCQPYLPGMRAEALARLGPTVNDPLEISQWKSVVQWHFIHDILEWLPNFRKLGVHLKRTVIPRKPSRSEHFDVRMVLNNDHKYAEIITLAPTAPIQSGYIIVDFHGSVSLSTLPSALRSHNVLNEVTDNSDLVLFMVSQLGKASPSVLRIGSLPISMANPLSIQVFSDDQKPNVSIRWFDE